MATEPQSHPSDGVAVKEPSRSQHGPEGFRPKRAKWACQACHKRKVRCDVLNSDTPCTNCRLDMKECVIKPRKKPRARTQASDLRDEATEAKSPGASPATQPFTTHPEANDLETEEGGSSAQMRKSNIQASNTAPRASRKRKRPSNGASGDELAQWMEKMPPSIMGELENIANNQDSVDKLNIVRFHTQCSEKLLQATNILTEVIFMHNSISAHLETSGTITLPEPHHHQTPDIHVNDDSNECVQYNTDFWEPPRDQSADIAKTVEESPILTPQSLDYISASNYNIWLGLNNFYDDPLPIASIDCQDTESESSSRM